MIQPDYKLLLELYALIQAAILVRSCAGHVAQYLALSPTDVTLRSGVKVAPRPKKPTGHSLINPSSKRYSGLPICHHADQFHDSDYHFPLLL